ncbi:MAG TPA: 50S ribosomal protein L21 [Patescibacteria group bacterium]
MDFAIIESNGKQYLVRPGEVINIEKPNIEGKIKFDKVLLVGDGGNIKVGKPYLDLSISGSVIGIKTNKIRVAKFKAKSRYRKVHGQRINLTQVKIDPMKTEGLASTAGKQTKKTRAGSKNK